jgi:AP-2 complex subunit beta-1
VYKVLKWATEEVDNPDLRDRGFMYWRMLAINPAVAGEIVLAEKPAITTDSDRMDRGALDQLLLHTGTLGSIYHKNPEVSWDTSCFSHSQASLTLLRLQTFIRNATGRALRDSPALNAHSRSVLVPLARPELPILNAVVVPGPGPAEPHAQQQPPPLPARNASPNPATLASKLPPPLPSDADAKPEANGDGDGEVEGDDDEPSSAGGADSKDPYSNLDGAFGNYLQADDPKPINRGRNAYEDDLLF